MYVYVYVKYNTFIILFQRHGNKDNHFTYNTMIIF